MRIITPDMLAVEAPAPVDTEDLEQFAQSRGLPATFLAEHGLHICPDDGPKPGWVGIPYRNVYGEWHTRYRRPHGQEDGPKYWGEPGSGTHLYNPQKIGPDVDLLIFAEGEIDALVLTFLGYPAMGIPGAAIGNKVFKGAWKLLFDGMRIVVAFDNDEPGQAAAARMLEAFAPQSRLLAPPGPGWDLNDWFKADAPGMKATIDALIEGWR